MQFINDSSITDAPVVQTFKNASWRSLAWVVLIMAVITAYVAIPKSGPTNPVLIAVPAMATLFFAGLGLWHFNRCRNQRNWLVKATELGLYINLQPNVHVPPAAEAALAIFLPSESIASITRVQEYRRIPGRHGEFKNSFTYFDICLHEALHDELLIALAHIRRNPARRGVVGYRKDLFGGVRLEDQYTIRLVWDWMTPRELAAEAWFAQRYTMGETKKFSGPGWGKMTGPEKDAYIDTLWEWGEVQDAIHLKSLKDTISERRAAIELADRLG